ncbi:hypothetical protein HK100_004469 [Physocladia obscura]|uniref:Uncharacterized protein n=1 Tax=Physocladia obscura TaxID=109957 RepID=A0AAD5T724_9FUNG|nr:hypothetical protein HK100_004469 [Physocladia obscura]
MNSALLLANALLLSREPARARAVLSELVVSIFSGHISSVSSKFATTTSQPSDVRPKISVFHATNRLRMAQYLLARACLDLGKLKEAEDSLQTIFNRNNSFLQSSNAAASYTADSQKLSGREKSPIGSDNALITLDIALEKYYPDDSSINCLMGQVYKKMNTFSLAKKYFETALLLNPFLWIACEFLCEMGIKIDTKLYFSDLSALNYLYSVELDNSDDENLDYEHHTAQESNHTNNFEQSELTTTDSAAVLPTAPAKRGRHPQSIQNNLAKTSSSSSLSITVLKRVKKRTKLSASNVNVVSKQKPPLASPKKQQEYEQQRQRSLSKRQASNEQWSTGSDDPPIVARQSRIIASIETMALAYRNFQTFNCLDAITALESLPSREFETGWVYVLIARSFFEMAEYLKAEEWFAKARILEPYRVSGMDVYSSTLWHLRKEVALSHLAHELVEAHRLTWQAWCAIGNCFSLKREHDIALKCFTRAIQINAECCYAHTLCGHEYISMEDNEKAMQCFRVAVRCDKRHYNAWFGMGYIYLTQEKYELAEFHFKKALEINHSNPVLILYMGVAYEKKKQPAQSQELYRRAIVLRPDIPLYSFRLATILHAQQDYRGALEVLQPLLAAKGTSMGSESAVHFLLGKCLNGIGDVQGAIRAFTCAQDVASGKVVGAIREEIQRIGGGAESMDTSDGDDDDDDDDDDDN